MKLKSRRIKVFNKIIDETYSHIKNKVKQYPDGQVWKNVEIKTWEPVYMQVTGPIHMFVSNGISQNET